MKFSAMSIASSWKIPIARIEISFWGHPHLVVICVLSDIHWIHTDRALASFVCVNPWSSHLIIAPIYFYRLHFRNIERIGILRCFLGNNPKPIIRCIWSWTTWCFWSSFLKSLYRRSRQRFRVLLFRWNVSKIAAF